MNAFAFFGSLKHYAGKVRTLRNEARTDRFLSALPQEIRKDIGWPDRYAERHGRGN